MKKTELRLRCLDRNQVQFNREDGLLPGVGVWQYYGGRTGGGVLAMAQNGQNRASAAREVNPGHIVSVKDFSPVTLRNVIAHLKVSTSFEHLVYREAELDAIWTITGFFLANEPASSRRDEVNRLHAGAHKAHDLVAKRRPGDAAAVLEGLL